jgi:hypothetical protein
MTRTYHVVPSVQGKWSVLKGGSDRAIRNFSNEYTAIEYAKKIADKEAVPLYLHRKDGSVVTKISEIKI